MTRQQAIEDFISRHRLPNSFVRLINDHYIPLSKWIVNARGKQQTFIVGISGAQGTGKSTLADFLRLDLKENRNWKVAVLSIDDFYCTKAERRQLSLRTHPLLQTRGVPGTHDIHFLKACIQKLRSLGPDIELRLPRFDKALDERAPTETWHLITGPVDLIILEGWCVGSQPQNPDALHQPINRLERDSDPDGSWRRLVNQRLGNEYALLFSELDALFFLQAPDFDTIFTWRLEQEEKLDIEPPGDRSGIMDRAQLSIFIEHFERVTRASLVSLPTIADIVLRLDKNHECVQRTENSSAGKRRD